MVTQQLIDYIKQQSSQGAKPEEIKKVLRANGWDESDVNQTLKSLGGHQIEAAGDGSFGDSFAVQNTQNVQTTQSAQNDPAEHPA